ncbi:MAG: hypothetical protein QXW06_04645 [Thermoplasmata archaeon]
MIVAVMLTALVPSPSGGKTESQKRVELKTFSDGSSEANLVFSLPGDQRISLRLPKRISILSAEMDVSGGPNT